MLTVKISLRLSNAVLAHEYNNPRSESHRSKYQREIEEFDGDLLLFKLHGLLHVLVGQGLSQQVVGDAHVSQQPDHPVEVLPPRVELVEEH